MAFDVLPEPLDRVEIGAIGRQIKWFDVMPMQTFCLVPAGVVEHENDFFSFLLRHFLCKGIEKSLKDFLVIMGNDEADKVSTLRMNCCDDVFANVCAEVRLCRTTASLDPFLSRSWITLKSRFIGKINNFL